MILEFKILKKKLLMCGAEAQMCGGGGKRQTRNDARDLGINNACFLRSDLGYQ